MAERPDDYDAIVASQQVEIWRSAVLREASQTLVEDGWDVLGSSRSDDGGSQDFTVMRDGESHSAVINLDTGKTKIKARRSDQRKPVR